jgi:hypothetical protein
MVKAFLIGAGATRAQFPNAPISDDFFESLFAVDPDLFEAIENAIQPYLGRSLIGMNIEDIMIKSYKFNASPKLQFISNLFSAIHKVLTHFVFGGPINRDNTGPETTFKTLLNDPRLSTEDFFITLNYDLYLDREIHSIQHKIDYGVDKQYISSNKVNHSDLMEFSLYHLHGSLNWELLTNNKVNINHKPIIPRYGRNGSNLCLIPPGNKNLNPVLESVWANAMSRLQDANELIIIGCSLNPQDTHLRELFSNFMSKRGSSNVKIIYLDDFQFQQNYLDIFGYGSGFQLYPYGFDLHGINKPPHRPGAIEFIFKD